MKIREILNEKLSTKSLYQKIIPGLVDILMIPRTKNTQHEQGTIGNRRKDVSEYLNAFAEKINKEQIDNKNIPIKVLIFPAAGNMVGGKLSTSNQLSTLEIYFNSTESFSRSTQIELDDANDMARSIASIFSHEIQHYLQGIKHNKKLPVRHTGMSRDPDEYYTSMNEVDAYAGTIAREIESTYGEDAVNQFVNNRTSLINSIPMFKTYRKYSESNPTTWKRLLKQIYFELTT